jgi:ech hydrogenase subunit C
MGIMSTSRVKSPWIVHVNCNSCNGCDIELVAALTPVYDVERFGIINVGNPKHADVMIVTGSVNYRNKRVLENLYDQMPEPKLVVALGACGATGGIFKECYNVVGGVDQVIPVDAYVPGCPPRPEAIIDGVVAALGKMEEKTRLMKLRNQNRKNNEGEDSDAE